MPWTPGDDIPSAVSPAEAAALASLARGGLVLELGMDRARSTIALAHTALMVHTVDWGLALEAARANISSRSVAGRVVMHIGDIANVLPRLAPGFDGVFIDAGHSYPEVVRDVRLVLPLLKPRAWLAFHDVHRGPVAQSGCDVDRAIAGLPEHLGYRRRDVEHLAILEPV